MQRIIELLRKVNTAIGGLQLLLGIILGSAGAVTVSNVSGCSGFNRVPPATDPGTKPDAPKPFPGGCPDAGTFDKIKSVVKIQFGNAGCSGTVVYPQLPDGRVLILTASHCLAGQPTSGVAIDRDGRRFGVHRVSHDPASDHGWLMTDLPQCGLNYTYLTEAEPQPGDPVYHCGFGTDVPGNIETGKVVSIRSNPQKIEYSLSVSHGDSGGGIAFDKNGHVISPVCCTTNIGGKGSVYGCHPRIARASRPSAVVSNAEWTPIPIPLIEVPMPMPME